MSPEQLDGVVNITGSAGPIDFRTDVFGLGVVLYELLTGRRPFDVDQDANGLPQRLLDAIRTGCRPLRSLNCSVPRSLAATIERCLEWAPDRRFSSAMELRDALQAEASAWKRLLRLAASNRRTIYRAVALASFAVATWCVYAAWRGPLEEVYFARGVKFEHVGDYAGAAKQFERALTYDPKSHDASFELGRTYIRLKRVDDAREIFYQLSEAGSDPRSEAFFAYCRSLRGNEILAIPYYERALAKGECGEAENNLAVAYDRADRSLGREERNQKIESCLIKALKALPESTVVRFNWLRFECRRFRTAPQPITPRALEFAAELTASAPASAEVYGTIAEVYCLASRENAAHCEIAVAMLIKTFQVGGTNSLIVSLRDSVWDPLRQRQDFQDLDGRVRNRPSSAEPGPLFTRTLEPGVFVLNNAAAH